MTCPICGEESQSCVKCVVRNASEEHNFLGAKTFYRYEHRCPNQHVWWETF
jgi:hypothetical protein